MNSRSKLAMLAGTAAVSLVLPAAAQAVTKQVYEGLPPQPQKKFIDPKYNTDAIDFFPHTATIHVGDSVKFSATAFHNVDIPARGKKPVDLLVAGAAIAGSNDAAGAPYWFNGLPNFGFNPALVSGHPPVNYDPFKTAKGKGRFFTYTGAKGVATPIPFEDNPKPLTVKFAKKTLKAQIDRDFKIAKTLNKTPMPANTISVGYAGAHGVEFFGYLPTTTTVPAGTTVRFQMSPKSYESHTATTGPGDPIKDPNSYLSIIAASFFSPQFVPQGVYPSQPFGAVASLTPTSHGNGFWNSGALDVVASSPQPASASVTFSAPGTYQFYCMVHPQMHGTVIVT